MKGDRASGRFLVGWPVLVKIAAAFGGGLIAVLVLALAWSRAHQVKESAAPVMVKALESEPGAVQPDAPSKANTFTETKEITIRPGTRISVRLAERLGTDRNHTGDVFRGTLASPIIENGVVIADAGASVMGLVVEAHKPPLLHGRAELSLAINSLRTKQQGAVRIRTATCQERGAHEKVINAGKRGVVLPVGTEIAFELAAPLRVKMKVR